MIKTTGFEHITDPYTIHIARELLPLETVERLYASAPGNRYKRIEVLDTSKEKQYAMNLLYLQKDSKPTDESATLSAEWQSLVKDLRSDWFMEWLEAGTGLELSDLPTDIGIYTHNDGDYISVHKDKSNKSITAILYLNPEWPTTAGGAYEVRNSGDADDAPVRSIYPEAGQFLAFPPSDHSWHAVSKIDTGQSMTRLTVQLEFWLDPTARGH